MDLLITIGILAGLAIMIYSRIKNQDLKETWEELKALFSAGEVDNAF